MHLFKHHYFSSKPHHGFISLYLGKLITNFAISLVGIFLPIFLYNTFNGDFQLVMAYYATASILYVVCMHRGAVILNAIGWRRGLRMSVFFGAGFWFAFFMMNETNLWVYVPLSLFFLTLNRITYWIPYHIDFAKFTDKANRGKQVSAMWATRIVTNVVVPVVGGYLIATMGFNVLFIVAMVLFILSGIPYISIPRTNEIYTFDRKKYLKALFSKKRRSMLITYLADGAETYIGLIVWPIFIFMVLDGNYFEVGALTSLVVGATVFVQLLLGKYIDKYSSQKRMLHFGSALNAIGWLLKIFIITAFHIFIAGVYHNVAKIFTRTPFDTLTYETAADQGHYVDEFTVLKETAMHSGRALMGIITLIVSIWVPVNWVFVLAAVAALGINLLWTGERTERVNLSAGQM